MTISFIILWYWVITSITSLIYGALNVEYIEGILSPLIKSSRKKLLIIIFILSIFTGWLFVPIELWNIMVIYYHYLRSLIRLFLRFLYMRFRNLLYRIGLIKINPLEELIKGIAFTFLDIYKLNKKYDTEEK